MYHLITKRLWPYIAPFRSRIVVVIFFAFILAAIGGAQTYLVKPLFDQGLSKNGSAEDAYFLAGMLLALGLLNFPCRFFHFYWLRYIQDRAICKVREEIFEKLMRLPASYYGESKMGNLISHLLNDANVFAAKVKNNQKRVQDDQGELTHFISEGINSHKITKAFNLENFVFSRFKKAQESFFSSQMRTTFVEEVAHPLVEVVGACAFAGVIVFAHHRISSGATSIGEFVSFITALALFMDPLRKFSQANVKLSQAYAANERIQSVLGHEEERDTGRLEVHQFLEELQVSNLSFSYGESNVISNMNLNVKKGQKVALVGLSGSGKSTLINLLLGLYDLPLGSIKIDGYDINEFKLKCLRSQFGLVSQDIFLFNDTIRNNLCLGKDIEESTVREALKVSYADEFVDKMPEGLDTIVGDRGTRLSGGQKQRLTIARAYLQEAPILLFDEATSALDNESEKVVQKALDNLAGEKTVIAVAHRLSTIQNYDVIFVMNEGRLVESGSHDMLMAKKGDYAKLYELSIQ